MSKTFALPGLRIGWLATRDRALLQRLAAFKDYTTICNSAPSEILALVALRRLEQVVARTHAIVDANLPLVDEFFERWRGTFEWVRPRGASIGFPRLCDSDAGRGLRARRWPSARACCCFPAPSTATRATTSGSASGAATSRRR